MRVSIVLVVVLLPLWPSLARAQQQPAQSTGSLTLQRSATAVAYPALYSPPFGAEHALGDWAGARPWLEDHGIDIGLNYFAKPAAIVAGGQRQGIDYTSQIGLSVDLDGQKLVGLTALSCIPRSCSSTAAAPAPISCTTTSMLCSRSLVGAAMWPPTWSISMANRYSTTGGWTSQQVGCRWAPTSRARRSTATS